MTARAAPHQSERDILAAIRLALGKDPRVVLWRNSTGQAQHWNGRTATTLRYGLAVGSADLVGLVAPSGRFLALEVKAPGGRATAEQEGWLALVRRMGGHACIVRSVDDALAALEEACRR